MCRRLATILFLCCGLLMAFSQLQAAAPVERGKVIAVAVEGPIGPATVDLISGALATAEASNATLVVLAMDTPGGLDSSMRLIIKQILASPVPFATYVSPRAPAPPVPARSFFTPAISPPWRPPPTSARRPQ